MHIEHPTDLLPYATDFHTEFPDTCYHGLIIICFSESNVKLNCHQSLKAAACLFENCLSAQTTTNHVMSMKTPHRMMTPIEDGPKNVNYSNINPES